MDVTGQAENFSLLGGPLHRLGCRIGLVRGTNTFALGLAIGAFLWGVLVALAYIEGIADRVFSLTVAAGHVRLLVGIPLFFLCETWLAPELTTFVRTIVNQGVVPKTASQALHAEIAGIARRQNSWWPEILCLLAAALWSFSAPHLHMTGVSAALNSPLAITEMNLTAQWYWIVCLTAYRFLLLRWVWRFGLWCIFLWRLSRLDLHLVATHPDGVGGLRYLEVVHSQFVPLILAMSAVQSASFAEEIVAGTMTIELIYPAIALNLAAFAAVFLGPLYIFASKLTVCREQGVATYVELAGSYVNEFERKWLFPITDREPLLGTPDLQSLADLSNSFNIVRNMSVAPASSRLMMTFAIYTVLPMLPLALLLFPIDALVEKLLKGLLGL